MTTVVAVNPVMDLSATPVNAYALRRDEVRTILGRAKQLCLSCDGVVAGLLVGSWARAAATLNSDLDIMLVVRDRAAFLATPTTLSPLVAGMNLLGEQDRGIVRERRYRTETGMEVELNIVDPGWLVIPPDPGTARVLKDGTLLLTDPQQSVRKVLAVLGLTPRWWNCEVGEPAIPPTQPA